MCLDVVYHLDHVVNLVNLEVSHLNPEVYHLNLEVYHLNLDVFHLNLEIYHLSHRSKFNSSSSFIFWKVGPDKSSWISGETKDFFLII